MNTTYRAIPSGHFRSMRPPAAFRWVRDRAAQINGIAEATMTRDEGYQFLVLGRSIERADMTSRLVATAALTVGLGRLGYAAAGVRRLRGVPAHLPGPGDRARRRGVPAARPALPALGGLRAQPGRALPRAPRVLRQRAGFQNEAQRLLGRTRAELEYRSLSDFVADLPSEMERLQRTCAQATDAITRRYFAGAEAPEWHGVAGHEHAAADRAHHRLRVRRQGEHLVQRGPADAADPARPDRRALPGRGLPDAVGLHYRDYWGAQVTAFEVLDPHESLTVTASVDRAHRPRRRPAPPTMTWEEIAQREVADLCTEFLTLPDRVAPDGRPRRAGQEIADAAPTPGEAAREVCALVYRRGQVRLRLDQRRRLRRRLVEQRTGVCQDMAHIAIGALRSVGIPARYVSGYLHPQPTRCRRARGRASRTPGSSGGTTAGAASTRPTTPSPATATSSCHRPRLQRRQAALRHLLRLRHLPDVRRRPGDPAGLDALRSPVRPRDAPLSMVPIRTCLGAVPEE